MRLQLIHLTLVSPQVVAALFLDDLGGDKVEATFSLEGGRVVDVQPDVYQWCEGSAAQVRSVTRAVVAFAEASALSRLAE